MAISGLGCEDEWVFHEFDKGVFELCSCAQVLLFASCPRLKGRSGGTRVWRQRLPEESVGPRHPLSASLPRQQRRSMSVPLFLQHWPGASGKLIPLLFGRVIFDLNGHDGHGGHWSGIRVGVDFEMGVKTEITLPLFGPDVRSALLCPQLRARLRLRIHDVLITALLDIFGGAFSSALVRSLLRLSRYFAHCR